MISIDNIRELIEKENFQPDFGKPFQTGLLLDKNSRQIEYQIFVGWDFLKANQCDQQWGVFNTDLLQFIQDQNYSAEQLQEIDSYIQLSDAHWDWLKKSCILKSDEYKWFYLYADGKPQAVCLIYHPKTSVISGSNIFYIEYIAVAPWNRKNPMAQREFSGLGNLLIRFVTAYAASHLNLTPGFSLHSLPTAAGFYENIGMSHIRGKEKEGMNFYEMPYENACKYLEAS
ncbi:hypothetical protein ACT43R_02950 [Acinetobacter baumannii]|nr:hypothetical protein [Acinetobacter baumannii]